MLNQTVTWPKKFPFLSAESKPKRIQQRAGVKQYLTLFSKQQNFADRFTWKEGVICRESRDALAMPNAPIVKVPDWIDLPVADNLILFSFLFF